MQRHNAVAIASLLLAAFVGGNLGCDASAPTLQEISQNELLESPPSKAVILDVRSAEEFDRGHVPNAIHIPYDELPSRLGELGEDTETPVVVYCESGKRADIAGATLLEAGWTNVSHLVGDMRAWREQGLPTAH